MRIIGFFLTALALVLILGAFALPFGWLAGLGLEVEGGWGTVFNLRPAYFFQVLLLALLWCPGRRDWRAGLATSLAAGFVLLWPAALGVTVLANMFASLSWGPLSLPLVYLTAKVGRFGSNQRSDPGRGRYKKLVLALATVTLLLSLAAFFFAPSVMGAPGLNSSPTLEDALTMLPFISLLPVFIYLLLRCGRSELAFMALSGVGALTGLLAWLWLGFDLISVKAEPLDLMTTWLSVEILVIQMLGWTAMVISAVFWLARASRARGSASAPPVSPMEPGWSFQLGQGLLLTALAASVGLAVMAWWVERISTVNYERKPVTQALRSVRLGDLSIKVPASADKLSWSTNINWYDDSIGPGLRLGEVLFENSDAAETEFEKAWIKEQSIGLFRSVGPITEEEVSSLFNRPARLINKPYRKYDPRDPASAAAADEVRFVLFLCFPEGYLVMHESSLWQPDNEANKAPREVRREAFLNLAQKVVAAYNWEGMAGRPETGFKTRYGSLAPDQLPGYAETSFIARWGENDESRSFEVWINPPMIYLRPRPAVFADRLKAVIGEINDYKVKSVAGVTGYETIAFYKADAPYNDPAYSSEKINFPMMKWTDTGPVSGSYAPSIYLVLSSGMEVEATAMSEMLGLWEILLEGVDRVATE